MLLQHFWLGLNNETALQLNITVGGSFAYKTTSEGMALLDRILENASFTEPLPVVGTSSQGDAPLAESTHPLVTHTDSLAEPSAKLEDPEEEEIIPPDFPFNIEEDIFFDYGNTTLYPLQKRPPVPPDPPNNLDKASLRETVKRVAAVFNSEWAQEGETSP